MNRRILIVDDEQPIRRLLEKMFCNEYQVLCAADAFEAMEMVKTNNVTLVISDQRMPGMTGVEFFTKIRLTHPHITRILLSGYIEKNDLEYAFENDLIHCFISKPWSVKELKEIVAEAVETQTITIVEQNLQLV
jgi:CheY-like chemotaxis protein